MWIFRKENNIHGKTFHFVSFFMHTVFCVCLYALQCVYICQLLLLFLSCFFFLSLIFHLSFIAMMIVKHDPCSSTFFLIIFIIIPSFNFFPLCSFLTHTSPCATRKKDTKNVFLLRNTFVRKTRPNNMKEIFLRL